MKIPNTNIDIDIHCDRVIDFAANDDGIKHDEFLKLCGYVNRIREFAKEDLKNNRTMGPIMVCTLLHRRN